MTYPPPFGSRGSTGSPEAVEVVVLGLELHQVVDAPVIVGAEEVVAIQGRRYLESVRL
jgi:hypothetical protein